MFAEIDRQVLKSIPFALNTSGHSIPQFPIYHPNGIPYHEFIWVTEYSAFFSIDGEEFILKEGNGLFIPAGTPHFYHADTSRGCSTSWFTFTSAPDIFEYLGIKKYLKFETPSFLESENIALMNFASGDSTPISRAATTYALISELFGALLPNPSTAADRVRTFIETRYSESLTLDAIAEAAGVTRYSLCHLYRKARGVSVMEDLTRIRIAKAKRFLKYTTCTVAQIGQMCGFENPGYFTKCFKDRCGVTPGEYRKLIAG